MREDISSLLWRYIIWRVLSLKSSIKYPDNNVYINT